MSSKQKYYYSIDLFRGLASISILVWHYHSFYWYGAPSFPQIAYLTQPFYDELPLLYKYGGLWIIKFFWIISGFVFAFVYWREKISFKNFFLFRFARLYPLHLITLLVIAFLQTANYHTFGYYQIVLNNDLFDAFLHILFASGWGFSSINSFNSPIWSVSVEILIYGLFFLSLRFLNQRPFLISLSSLILLLTLSLIIELGHHWIAQCGFFFFTGVLVFLLVDKFETTPRSILLFSFISLLSALLFYEGIHFTLTNQLVNNPQNPIFILKYIGTMVLIFSSILFFLAWFDTKGYSYKIRFSFQWIGNSTYSIYLWHTPMQVLILFIMDFYAIDRQIFDYPITLVIWILFMIILGRVSYLYIEKPLKHIIKRNYSKRKKINDTF